MDWKVLPTCEDVDCRGPFEGQPTLLTIHLARNLPLSLAGEATLRAAAGTEATLMEAVKARLDARAHGCACSSKNRSQFPASLPPRGEPSRRPYLRTRPIGARDHERQLLLRTAGQIINDGPDIIQVQLHPPLTLAEAPNADLPPAVQYAHTVLLRPGASAPFRLEEARSLHEWINNWEARLPSPRRRPLRRAWYGSGRRNR